MSRSYKKTAAGTCARCASQKSDKKLANRRLRRRLADIDAETDIDIREVSDVYFFVGDGKRRYTPFEVMENPQLMRK